MMNNTYSVIISQSERAWSFQWARTLFALERKLGDKEKIAFQRLYSINMAAPEASEADDEKEETSKVKAFVPALMIIKRMNWTRAERRRLIVGYWQVSEATRDGAIMAAPIIHLAHTTNASSLIRPTCASAGEPIITNDPY